MKIDNPEWAEGNPLPEGWREVQDIQEVPTPGIDELVYELEPAIVDGVLTRVFAVRSLTTEEIEHRDAPKTAKAKLLSLGLSEAEIEALTRGLLR